MLQLRPAPRPLRRRLTGWALAALGPTVLTSGLVPLRAHMALSSVLLLFLLTVLLAAAVGGLGPALAASVLGFGLINWFFTPPFHTLEVEHLENVLALAVFLVVGAVVSWYATTAARRAAEAARAEAGTELRNTLLAAVSHDLRTPIASIKASATSLLADDVAWSPTEMRQFTVAIDEETDRLSALVANLLDMTRLQAGPLPLRRVEVGVDELVLAAVASLGDRASSNRLDVDVDEDLPAVTTDPSLVERALANVIDNALAWSPPGARATVTAVVAGPAVEISVVDHGPGIAPGERERVFLPFQRSGDRSNGPGVGLGLAVARGLLGAVAATVTAQDTPGGGATVVVRLPIGPGPEVGP